MTARLVIAAHGSGDPRFALVVESIGSQVRALRADLDVSVGYLDHGPPLLTDTTRPGDIVVPLFLSGGHHVRVDVPIAAPDAIVTRAVGPDPLLLPAIQRRLHEARWNGTADIVLAAAGSREPDALDEIRDAASQLSDRLSCAVTAAFISGGEPAVRDIAIGSAIASYLLAPGHFHDLLRRAGAAVVSDPVGDAPELAAIVVDRYNAAQQR